MISFDAFQPSPKTIAFGIRFTAADPALKQLWHSWSGQTPLQAVYGLLTHLTATIPSALMRLAGRHKGVLTVTVIALEPSCVPPQWKPGLRFIMDGHLTTGYIARFKFLAARGPKA